MDIAVQNKTVRKMNRLRYISVVPRIPDPSLLYINKYNYTLFRKHAKVNDVYFYYKPSFIEGFHTYQDRDKLILINYTFENIK